MYEPCLNCGYDYGLHHSDSLRCPKGGEAPIGKRQEYLETAYTPNTANQQDEIQSLKDHVKRLEGRIAMLERQMNKVNEAFPSTR